MPFITLYGGERAQVSEEDYERVSALRWSRSSNGYVVNTRYIGNYRSRSTLLHRYITNAPKGMYVDHINGDVLDNRRENLRLCTNSQNNVNKGPTKLTRSGLRGAYWNAECRKWQANIQVNGKSKYLGLFSTPEEASAAYMVAARELYGDFAWNGWTKKGAQETPRALRDT